ncbi:hypothetical protein [Oribacterium sp. NK2B42]|uniref:hypothetical protein n=1 Tax=Oribacterium sp. NK2B42 TaxID=689781 RepID=UPI0005D2A766|nr:hypothetical protein [Oribacterium sp. NK2B42]
MQYLLTDEELLKMKNGVQTALGIPFIDAIEDYILEAIWEYAKDINGIDPLYNIRSKKLYDVVDEKTHIGWSVKSIQWAFRPECTFELVIQRANVFKKAADLGFGHLDRDSDPQEIGAALIKHWSLKVNEDAIAQNVTDKRVMILLKSADNRRFAVLEEDLKLYNPDELVWHWTNATKTGLQGVRKDDNALVYRWYPGQTQFFESFVLPAGTQEFTIEPIRMRKDQVVDRLLPYLQALK